MFGKTKTALQSHGLAPSKKRGQNFLIHQATAQAIVDVASFNTDDHIIEVGVGLGALTVVLARQVAGVIGIEIDRGIIEYHRKEKILPDNTQLLHQDILKTDFTSFSGLATEPYKIISNLPYSISNPFIFKLIENKHLIEQVVILLQKEVADRLIAAPRTKEYGIPTVLLGSCATVTNLMRISASEFHPQPKVDSQLIRIVFDKNELSDDICNIHRTIVRAAFSARRKTLMNNLLSSESLVSGNDKTERKTKILRVFESVGLSADIRAEALTIEQFHLLALSFADLR